MRRYGAGLPPAERMTRLTEPDTVPTTAIQPDSRRPARTLQIVRFAGKSQSPFAVRGVIEAFYGPPYTTEERDDLIRFLARQGLNTYIYGPKNDHYHRERWWHPYPQSKMKALARNIHTARENNVDFWYAVSCGFPKNHLRGFLLKVPKIGKLKDWRQSLIDRVMPNSRRLSRPFGYASEKDFNTITRKMQGFYDLGVRSFSLFFDDMADWVDDPVNRKKYGSPAAAQADFANRVFAWLQAQDPETRLSICPTDYHGRAPFSDYLHTLGENLNPEIDIFYTGPEICSPAIRNQDARDFARAVGRPPLIWDNYPVNDAAMVSEFHGSAYTGRDGDLFTETRGIVANPMVQKEASKIALSTFATYMKDPQQYDPKAALQQALQEVGGSPQAAQALAVLNRYTAFSCMDPQQEGITPLVEAALHDLSAKQPATASPAVAQLADELRHIQETCRQFNQRVENPVLQRELKGWVENLEYAAQIGLSALSLLEAQAHNQPTARQREALEQQVQHLEMHGHRSEDGKLLRTMLEHLQPLIELAQKQAAQRK